MEQRTNIFAHLFPAAFRPGRRFLRLLALAVVGLAFGGAAAGSPQTNRLVRVACYADFAGFCEVRPGQPRPVGYFVDYIQAIANYAGWQLEFIPAEWGEQQEMVRTGRADLIGDLSFTPERERDFLFAPQAMGIEHFTLYALPSFLAAKRTGRPLKVGVLADSVQLERLREWSRRMGIPIEPHLYPSFDARVQATLSGEIDLLCEVDADVSHRLPDLVPVHFIGSSEYFLALSRKRPDLYHDLVDALAQIMVVQPNYVSKLQSKYLKRDALKSDLLPEERARASRPGGVAIGYLDRTYPFTYKGGGGQPQGAVIDVIREACTHFNLNFRSNFTFKPFASMDELHQALRQGAVDAVFPVYIASPLSLSFPLTFPVYKLTMSTFIRPDIAWKEDVRTIGVREGVGIDAYVARHYPQVRQKVFPTYQACVDYNFPNGLGLYKAP